MRVSKLNFAACVACLLAHLSACTSWQFVSEPPATIIARERPSPVRVTHSDGHIVLVQPQIRADSLAGISESGERASLPLDDIRGLELRRTSTWRTIGLVYAIAATAITVGALISTGGEVAPSFGG